MDNLLPWVLFLTNASPVHSVAVRLDLTSQRLNCCFNLKVGEKVNAMLPVQHPRRLKLPPKKKKDSSLPTTTSPWNLPGGLPFDPLTHFYRFHVRCYSQGARNSVKMQSVSRRPSYTRRSLSPPTWGCGHGTCTEQLCPESYPRVRPVRLNPRGRVVCRRKTSLNVGASTSTALNMVHQVGLGRETQSAIGASVFIDLVVRFHVLPARLLLDHGSMPLRRLCEVAAYTTCWIVWKDSEAQLG